MGECRANRCNRSCSASTLIPMPRIRRPFCPDHSRRTRALQKSEEFGTRTPKPNVRMILTSRCWSFGIFYCLQILIPTKICQLNTEHETLKPYPPTAKALNLIYLQVLGLWLQQNASPLFMSVTVPVALSLGVLRWLPRCSEGFWFVFRDSGVFWGLKRVRGIVPLDAALLAQTTWCYFGNRSNRYHHKSWLQKVQP